MVSDMIKIDKEGKNKNRGQEKAQRMNANTVIGRFRLAFLLPELIKAFFKAREGKLEQKIGADKSDQGEK